MRLPGDVVWSEVLAEDFCHNFCSPGAFKPSTHPSSQRGCPGGMAGVAGCYVHVLVQSLE